VISVNLVPLLKLNPHSSLFTHIVVSKAHARQWTGLPTLDDTPEKCLIKFGMLGVLLFGTTEKIGNIYATETKVAIQHSFRNSKN
jgi:hypothetical protein